MGVIEWRERELIEVLVEKLMDGLDICKVDVHYNQEYHVLRGLLGEYYFIIRKGGDC